MRKAIMVKIISLGVVVILLAGFLIVNLVSPGFLGFNGLGFNAVYTYDESGYSVGNAELDHSINSISINWSSGSVKVSVTDKNMLRIYEDESIEEKYKLRYKVTNDNSLDIQFIGSGQTLPNNVNKALVIEIPKDLADKMDKISISAASADVSVSDITSRSLTLDTASGNANGENIKTDSLSANTASGDVNFDNALAQELMLDTASGAVYLEEIVAKKIECNTSSGDMTFSGQSDDMSFDTASGKLTAEFFNSPKSIYANTSSGDVALALPKDIKGFSASLDTASGDLKCDFSSTLNGEDEFLYGESGVCSITANTASGNLTIRQK